ncbi:MAG: FMN-binding protein [Bacteroidales bacterium]|nr:FMN-binding protein [Bacteroidales bacterium]
MKKILVIAIAVIALTFGTSRVIIGRNGSATAQTDTVKVNSVESGKKFIGFNGRTPVEIALVNGRIVYVKALQNTETPAYFNLVKESGLFEKLNGLTVDEALATELDAVSGATYSSEAVIGNIRAALSELE